MTEPLLFCRVGWMVSYTGPEPAIMGAGSGQAVGNEWEAFNFAPYKGRVYGYCSGGRVSRSIDTSRLHGAQDTASGITVVWVSPHPTAGKQRIVGWYTNATVHRYLQRSPLGRQCNVTDGQRVEFNIEAPEPGAVLLKVPERIFQVPRARGFMGQANVGFMDSDEAVPFLATVKTYISAESVRRANSAFRFPEEVMHEHYVEGAIRQVYVNAFERDARAREACLQHFGRRCQICGCAMSDIYGPLVNGLIHVHHVKPLSSVRRATEVDPIRDMIPVCPNCHAVAHSIEPPYTPTQIKDMMAKARRNADPGTD
jgi:hypothetical protein